MGLTDEEFEEVEKSFTREELECFRKDVVSTQILNKDGTSGAASFLIILGVLIIFAGLIIGLSVNNVTFASFISVFIIYALAGGFCFCAAELFNKLQKIVNLMQKK